MSGFDVMKLYGNDPCGMRTIPHDALVRFFKLELQSWKVGTVMRKPVLLGAVVWVSCASVY